MRRRPLITTLDRAGDPHPGPRRALTDLIDARPGHFTAADLLADARVARLAIGRATVFRALDLLEELDALERLDLPDGGHAYVVCAPAHHHHAICSGCGRVTEVDDHALTDAVAEIERHTGWTIESHRLELYGRCPSCPAPRPA
ncbi:MAG: Fur family transcriptional regulator [Chloroflexota bacterium]